MEALPSATAVPASVAAAVPRNPPAPLLAPTVVQPPPLSQMLPRHPVLPSNVESSPRPVRDHKPVAPWSTAATAGSFSNSRAAQPTASTSTENGPATRPTRVPTFLASSPASDESDSSSDDEAKPPRPTKYDRQGRPRPRPSYYYDPDYDISAKSLHSRTGRRGGAKGVPVFEPTVQEFAEQGGFYGYVQRIEKYGMRSGIVKVIPPASWVQDLPSTAIPLRNVRLKEPIEQHLVGSQGLYRVTNVAKTRIWNPAQWKDMSEASRYAGPDFAAETQVDRTDRAVPVAAPRSRVVPFPTVTAAASPIASVSPSAGPAPAEQVASPASPTVSTPTSATTNATSPATVDSTLDSAPLSTAAAAVPLPVVVLKPKRPSNLQRAEPTDAEWEAFIAQFEALPYGMTKEGYTIEFMRQVERRYWRTLTFGEAPMYGADMQGELLYTLSICLLCKLTRYHGPGSLFNDSTKSWNVAHLGDLLPRLAPATCKIPGVVSPYLYFGMWRATFAWHVEDADLYSINYIHFGAPKFWYSVPQANGERFERVMEGRSRVVSCFLVGTDQEQCGDTKTYRPVSD